ncbi:MAG: hypothetical protein CMM50_08750 [Rhodospirillaceae bacterium]|nr:hypothetical protein [Rhodospirillaceae bacterium]|tara:strand:+ start:782 stop:1102 length:321 start_codon:yes stop_codon:yes gene_type:complete
MSIRLGGACLAVIVGLMAAVSSASAGDKINAEVLNFSDQDRWVQVTDMICNEVLYKDKLGAQTKLPVSLCTDDTGHAKLQFYIRIGCTKNQTIIKKDIVEGQTVSF